MLAAWYDRQGSAGEVLQIGDLPVPEPVAGEVRVRVALSGVNPGRHEETLWLARRPDGLPPHHPAQ